MPTRRRCSVAQAQVQEALQAVYEVRVSLGLPPQPESGTDLTKVPDDLNQTFSSVREAQAKLMQAASAAQGVVTISFRLLAATNGCRFLQA